MAHETLDQIAAYGAAKLPINRDALPEEALSVNGRGPDVELDDPTDGPEPISGDWTASSPD